jgi:Fic family protein
MKSERNNAPSGGAAEPMGRYEERFWEPNLGAPGRKHRRGGAYKAFVPVPLAERAFELDDEAVATIVAATKELTRLNSSPPRVASLESLARNLVRSEAVASSRIEGLALSHKRLARAAYRPDGRRSGDRRAAEVLANVEAMEQAVDLGTSSTPLGVSDIQDIHGTLLRYTFDSRVAGVIREHQNWIGGSDYHPLDAAFVPPPHEYVKPLLADLCEFIERDDIAPIAQAAIAHAQFETIHPFGDGNGRVGRALIYTILRRRGEAARYIPPISLVLAAEPRTYIGGLVDYRDGQLSAWCTMFASATQRAAREASELSERIEALQQQWLERLKHPRSDAAVRQLVAALPSQPVLDVAAGQRLTGKSHVAVGNALKQLEAAGIVQRLNEKKWGRLWECGGLLQLVTDFEAQVSTT